MSKLDFYIPKNEFLARFTDFTALVRPLVALIVSSADQDIKDKNFTKVTLAGEGGDVELLTYYHDEIDKKHNRISFHYHNIPTLDQNVKDYWILDFDKERILGKEMIFFLLGLQGSHVVGQNIKSETRNKVTVHEVEKLLRQAQVKLQALQK